MGLFSFTQEIAMDLGTANSIIIHNDKIVVDEPSVVAIENKTDKLLAVGTPNFTLWKVKSLRVYVQYVLSVMA